MSSGPKSSLSIEYSDKAQGLSSSGRKLLIAELLATLENSFPAGLNLAIVDSSGVLLRAWAGNACVVGETIPTTRTTRYDLASLTKVIATTMLTLWLEEQSKWRLTDKVSSWLPGFTRSDITLHHLLTHTSGLIAHKPFFEMGQRPQAIRRAVYEEASRGGELGTVLYSDLNFMLLGWALARCSGQPLQRLFKEVIAKPLDMPHTSFRPSARDRVLTAATELDGDQRLEPGLVWGEVHDGNAWALGGVAGHAGLFAPADDVSRYLVALLNPEEHPVLSASTIAKMTRYQAGTQPDVRGLGWRLDPEDWGPWPSGTYWHNGFTGNSLLVSPRVGIGVVMLSNAIHPTRQLERQAQFRIELFNAIAKCCL
jgi:CubicO group peptidase (beta-lactamase class C family)